MNRKKILSTGVSVTEGTVGMVSDVYRQKLVRASVSLRGIMDLA